MHCMIDLTVYFLFFIALSKCAVLKSKVATEEDKMARSPDKLDTNTASLRDKRILLLFKGQNGKLITTDIEEDTIAMNATNSGGAPENQEQDADPWSVIWYLGAFSGLITFFLVVTCSEWCCGNHLYTRHYGANQVYASSFTHQAYRPPDTPPPPYHLFAPPSYKESVAPEKAPKTGGVKSLRRLGVFVIPVHRVKSTTLSDAAAAT